MAKFQFPKCPLCGQETPGFMVIKPFPDRDVYQSTCAACYLRATGVFATDKPTFMDGQNNWNYATRCLLGHELPKKEQNKFWHRCPSCTEGAPGFVKSVQDWIVSGKQKGFEVSDGTNEKNTRVFGALPKLR